MKKTFLCECGCHKLVVSIYKTGNVWIQVFNSHKKPEFLSEVVLYNTEVKKLKEFLKNV